MFPYFRTSTVESIAQQNHTTTMDLDGSDVSTTNGAVYVIRFLQSDIESHRGRTVLTVLYLCVLSLCFIVPVYFYCKMHCDDRSNRRLRELEIATITQAMTESQTAHREESRAQRRKYREERRARIIQLFAPVRMVRIGLWTIDRCLFQ